MGNSKRTRTKTTDMKIFQTITAFIKRGRTTRNNSDVDFRFMIRYLPIMV